MECAAVTASDLVALVDALWWAFFWASMVVLWFFPLCYRWTCDALDWWQERRERREWL